MLVENDTRNVTRSLAQPPKNEMDKSSSAESILTLKNRESIHYAKFAHDTCADTFF